ncbi:MAG: hypothetical protein AAB838_03115 [Patescibacteria group bacterium]
MQILLYGRYGEFPKELEQVVKNYGFEIIDPAAGGMTTPDVVVTYGGDGTLLGAERDWPGIPKLPLKNSDHCHLCYDIPNEKLLGRLVRGELKSKEYFKLEATVDDKKIIALNDIVIAHKFPNNAIRFTLAPSPYPLEPYIGDGLVIATPFGSTGYFYSVTKTAFTTGIGVAFNNIHNADIREKIIDENEEIKVKILRGPAVLAADNDPNLVDLTPSAEIIIKKSTQTAKILTLTEV